MKNERQGIGPDDPRLTAYALGELDPEERAAVEAALQDIPACQLEVAEIRAAAAAVEAEFAEEAPSGLSDTQRRAVAAAAEEAPRAAPRRSRLRRVGIWGGSIAATLIAGTFGMTLLMDKLNPPAVGSESASFRFSGGTLARAPASASQPPDAKRIRGQLRALGYIDSEVDRGSLQVLGYVGDDGRGDEIFEEEELAEGHNTESYDHIVENAFQRALDEPLSTFSIDVDTASYANVRRFLRDGRLPPPDAVRIEEFINYFSYDYPPPMGADPFSVSFETTSCPWKPQHRLARIGLQGKEIAGLMERPRNLVFLLDVSGSMKSDDKLPLLKRSMRLLVENLGPQDRVAMVVYAGASGLVLPSTPCSNRAAILEALERLDAGGSTNGGDGIRLAYRVARESFLDGGINRVILATDGDFNVGTTGRGELVRLIEEKAKSGVFLSVLGFGTGNLKDSDMEQLADKGNGNYAYIDSLHEARKVLVREMGGTLETIAKDVKIQVEFNPARALAWRLIGYENRILAHQDFNDDTKDAGEIGAGHNVTALYEIVPVGVPFEGAGDVDPLKYQRTTGESALSETAHGGELLTVKLRYKEPEGTTSRLLEFPLADTGAAWSRASEDLRFAATVACFGMVLRGSEHCGEASFETVFGLAREAASSDPHGYRTEFLDLVQRARAIRDETPERPEAEPFIYEIFDD